MESLHAANHAIPAGLGDGGDAFEIPIIGRVAAGQPILAQENVVDRVPVDRYFRGAVRGRDGFGRVVQGESMIDDGIFDGDYIFVRKQSTASPGEIVVAMVDGDATCKRYYPEGDRIRLQPANETMEPIYVSASTSDKSISSAVVGVYRRTGASARRERWGPGGTTIPVVFTRYHRNQLRVEPTVSALCSSGLGTHRGGNPALSSC